MKYSYDLHVHTTNSDGELSVAETLDSAFSLGLSGVAITDHDAIGGSDDIEASSSSPLEVIHGIEFATDISNMHLVGYMKSWDNGSLEGFLKEQEAAREASAFQVIKKAAKLNIRIDKEILLKDYVKGAPIGRPHIARYLVNNGYVESVPQAFKLYLAQGRPLYVKKERSDFRRIIDLCKNEFKMIVGLAHPFLINKPPDTVYTLIGEAVSCGIDGIEVFYPGHSEEQITFLKTICDQKDLLIMGGSDFHGHSVKPNVDLGDGGVGSADFKKLISAVETI